MKKAYMKIGLITISTALFCFAMSLQTNAQCEKKKFCEDNLDDYDYRSQSSFAKLSPGDTSSVSLVLYGNQRYRIFVCSDPKLGDVAWKIVNPERKTKRTIASIRKDTTVIYKLTETGDYATDDLGNLIVKDKKVNVDTLWNTERIAVDKVVFDNKKNSDKMYLEVAPKKSERYIVRVAIPGGDPNYAGCVNVYVGRLPMDSKNFSKQGKGKTNTTY
ncbi:MAG: hypothetical protein HY951_09380 [Bacteroidia bacterium]|nr:hypothetical protein [Bacteroidia bacterium]